MPAPRHGPAPAALAGYRVGPALGIGGFSTVFEVERDADGMRAAVKLAHGSCPDVSARFHREATALALIGRPHVPALLLQGALDDGRPFLVMEHVRGLTLAQLLARAGGPLALDAVLVLAGRILESLEAVHAHGLVHRDLKPDNVMLPEAGPARLVDFGLVSGSGLRSDASLTRAGTLVGTWEYMAPEQLRGSDVTTATDVYAFGLVLFELLTLRLPFAGDRVSLEHGHLVLRPPSPSRFRPLPAPLEQLVLACLAKAPGARPTVASLRADLEALRTDTAAPAVATSFRSPPVHTALGVDGQRPVALVHVAGPLPIHELQRLAAGHRARVARSRGSEAVLAVLGSEHDHPLEAAVDLAREAVTHPGTRTVVHVGRALVRRSSRGEISLYGRDLEQARAWVPTTPWDGVLLTGQAAAILGVTPDAGGDTSFVPAPAAELGAREPCSLLGRDREAERAIALVSRALTGARPTLCVIAGEEGMGTSAVAAHVCTESMRAFPDAEVIRLRCRRPLAGDGEQTLRRLLRHLLDVGPEPPVDPMSVLADRLGVDVARTVGRGVLVALGWRSVDEAVSAGSLRDEALHAAVSGLRRRANQRRLILLVDDVHFADDLTLQIIERSCASVGAPLCWILTCTPRFLDSRKAGAHRDGHTDAITLAPLDEDCAADLAVRLLPPGTTVSRDVLLRLVRWAGGNPSLLRDLIEVLRRENILRRHDGTRAWFVASDELDRLPSSPAIEWLAARELASLAPELADCARICSVIGPVVTLEELEAAVRVLERDALDRPLVDSSVGLAQLLHHGLLTERRGSFAFRRASLQEGLYALCPEALRLAVHDAVYRSWAALDDSADLDRLARMAHHGSRAGHHEEARACYVALAARAKATNAYAEGERMLSAALGLCPADDRSLRFRILVERGSLRRVLTRYEEARLDFAAARALAEDSNDRVGLVSVLVEEAAVCDFTDEWDAQARLVARAEALATGGLPRQVDARLRNWLGVTRARQGRTDEAIALLESAAALGATLGEHETEIGSLVLLGFLLVSRGEHQRGKSILDQAIATCEDRADAYHLAIGLLNRISYWDKEGPWVRAEQDCQRAVELAHEMGFHQLEIYGLHSLSIGRWWRGDLSGALAAARKAHELSMERFGAKSGHSGRLQYAYLLAFDGRTAEARELLGHIREDEIQGSPANLAYLRALHLAVDGGSANAWREALSRTREHGEPRDLIEVLWLRARSAERLGERRIALEALELAHAEALRCEAPIAPMLLAERRELAA